MQNWNWNTSRRVSVPFLDLFRTAATPEKCVLRSIIAAIGKSSSVDATSADFDVLAETYVDYRGNVYQQKLIEYPVFLLHLLKRCLQKLSFCAFDSLDPFSMREFIVTRLKRAEKCNWMMSRCSLRRAIITVELTMPSLVEVVANTVGVWPLIVSYLEETGREHYGDN